MFEEIRNIIADHLGIDNPSEITPDTDLIDDLNADSLDAVEIIMDIEDAFDVTISDEDANNIRTIQDIVTYIEENK